MEVVREVITGGKLWHWDNEAVKDGMTETSRQTEVHLLRRLGDSLWPLLAEVNLSVRLSIHPPTHCGSDGRAGCPIAEGLTVQIQVYVSSPI